MERRYYKIAREVFSRRNCYFEWKQVPCTVGASNFAV